MSASTPMSDGFGLSDAVKRCIGEFVNRGYTVVPEGYTARFAPAAPCFSVFHGDEKVGRLLVDRSGEPYLLEDALVDAGWTPPESAGVGQYGAPQ